LRALLQWQHISFRIRRIVIRQHSTPPPWVEIFHDRARQLAAAAQADQGTLRQEISRAFVKRLGSV